MRTTPTEEDEDDNLEIWIERHSQQAAKELFSAVQSEAPELSRKLNAAVSTGEPDFFAIIDGLLQALGGANPLRMRRVAASLIERATRLISPDVRIGQRNWLGCGQSNRWNELSARLLEALLDDDEVVCRHSLFAFRRIGSREGLDAFSAMLAGPLRAKDPQVVQIAVRIVMGRGLDVATRAIPAIAGLLDHGDPDVRCLACDTLAEFTVDARRAAPRLLQTAETDIDPNVRTRAAIALTEIDRSVALVPLVTMVLSTSHPERQRELLLLLLKIDVTAHDTSKAVRDPADRKTLIEMLIALGPVGREFRRALPAAWNQESETAQAVKRKHKKIRVCKGMFTYHRKDEQRPSKFAHGPVSGSQQELVKWIIPNGKGDPRQLERFADSTIWFQQRNYRLYDAYFCDRPKFQQTEKHKLDVQGDRPEHS